MIDDQTAASRHRRRRIHRPSPALVVALLALLVALGGTSYAAFHLPAGAVGTRELRAHAVTSSKLATGAVATATIRRGSVTPIQLANGAVTAGKLAPGAVGPAQLHNEAVTAAKLAPGAISPAAVPPGAGVHLAYRYGTIVLAPGQQLSVYVTCTTGSTVTGGGGTADQTAVIINDSAPFSSASGQFTSGPADSWGIYATNTDPSSIHTVGVYAICITQSGS